MAPGKFNVQLFPNRQLGDEKEMLEGLSFGTLDSSVITNSPISNIAKPFQVNDMPFMYANEAQAHKILDGPIGQKLLESLEKKKIIGLGFAEGGYRQMINNVRPVSIPKDVSGIKWRFPWHGVKYLPPCSKGPLTGSKFPSPSFTTIIIMKLRNTCP